jgi:hypothetical protein
MLSMLTAQSELTEIVAGKSVGVIGGNSLTVEIDRVRECDLILSVHNHCAVHETSPDIIFSGWERPVLHDRTQFCILNIVSPHFKSASSECFERGVSFMPYSPEQYAGLSPHGHEFEWHNAFSKELDTTPFTGLSALALLRMLPVREVFVTGYTFYWREDRGFPHVVPPHMIDSQLHWFRRLRANDARFSFDVAIEELFPIVSPVTAHADVKELEPGRFWRVANDG